VWADNGNSWVYERCTRSHQTGEKLWYVNIARLITPILEFNYIIVRLAYRKLNYKLSSRDTDVLPSFVC